MALLVAFYLTYVPTPDRAQLARVVFVDRADLVRADVPNACGEAHVPTHEVWIVATADCLRGDWLRYVLYHELGHLMPECAALWAAWQPAPAETCADRYAALWGAPRP